MAQYLTEWLFHLVYFPSQELIKCDSSEGIFKYISAYISICVCIFIDS